MGCPDARPSSGKRGAHRPGRAGVALALLGTLGCGDGAAGGSPASARASTAETPPPRPRPLAPELAQVARAVEEHRFVAARALAGEYVAAHPADGQGHFILGMTHYWTDNFGAARPWLERALELEPDIYIAHDFLGYSLFMLGDLRGARREYEAFEAVVPREPKAHYGLGLVELEEAALDEAARRFRRAIELFGELARSDPGPAAARRSELAECHARLADVHFARGDYESARAELLRATTLHPGNISSYYTLSLVHRRLGEEELADRAAAEYEAARQRLIDGQGSSRR